MPQVKLPKSFFIKERDNLYSSWIVAFAREMLQNSIDADSSRIDIRTHYEGENLIIEFEDNGHGMTRQVIEDVFFALGETTKTGSQGVGGFGRARILTCFAMESYEIWCNGLRVKGEGASYEIEDAPARRGCLFSINVGKYSWPDFNKAFRQVLRFSQLDCDVYLDGERWTDWLYRRRVIKTATFGNIHVNKSRKTNAVIVRVRGLFMYQIYSDANVQVIIEIDPDNSRKILTVNRDGLHYSYANDLQAFLNELSADTHSALRSGHRKTRLIEGTGSRITRLSQKELTEISSEIGETVEVGDRRAIAASGTIIGAIQINRAVSVESDRFSCEVIKGTQIQTGLPSIYLNDETNPNNPLHSKVRRVIDNFDPRNWVYSVKNIGNVQQQYRKGSTYLKLLVCWEACCLEAIRALLKAGRSDTEIRWLVGWTFSLEDEGDPESGACHVSLSQGHALCLNPVNPNGTLRYKLRSRDDQRRLMALAKHEVTHIVHRIHNEDFTSTHTEIDAHFDSAAASRAIKDALAQMA